jgi:hypothetical protein
MTSGIKNKIKKVFIKTAKFLYGYSVRRFDRDHYIYRELGLKVKLDTELVTHGSAPIYVRTLKAYDKDDKEITLDAEKILLVIERFKSGLKKLGVKYEMIDGNDSPKEESVIFRRDSISDIRSFPRK